MFSSISEIDFQFDREAERKKVQTLLVDRLSLNIGGQAFKPQSK